MATVLYVYPRLSSFIGIDRDALEQRFAVIDYEQPGKVPRLAEIVRGVRRADVVVGWWASWHTFVPFTLAWLLGKPSLLIVGGFDVAAVPEVGFGYQLGGFRRWASRWIIGRARALVTNSDYSREEIARTISAAVAARVEVIHHGMPDPFGEPVPRPGDPPVALTVGAVTTLTLEQKGQRPFVDAAALLPAVRFVLAGELVDAGAAAVLRERAGENAELRGWVEQPALEELYRRASVYVQASWHEGFGMAIAEAMLAGCVPVVRTAGSMPEVVGDAGVLIESSEPEAIAEGVRAALDLGEDGGRRARARIVEAFPLDARHERLQQAVERVLRAGTRRSP